VRLIYLASETPVSNSRKREIARPILFQLPRLLGVLLIVTSGVLMLAAGTYVDCETLTIATSICFLYWFNYPLQLSLVALGVLLVFSNRLAKYKTVLSVFGLGTLLTYVTGLIPYRGYSMILDSGNYPCQLLEYGFPLPWLAQIVTCTMSGSAVNQLIIPAGRFGLDTAVWTILVGFVFLTSRAKQLGRLTTILIGATALLGFLIAVLVLGTFS
jgi:hypothetical protein